MGQYNSKQGFKILETTNKKNDKYYFVGNTTTIPRKYYPTPPSIFYDAKTGKPIKNKENEEILKNWLLV